MTKLLFIFVAIHVLWAVISIGQPVVVRSEAVRLQQRIDMCWAEYNDPVKCTATNMAE